MSRWMLFVDGENFTIRAQKLAHPNQPLVEGRCYKRDCFVWYPSVQANYCLRNDALLSGDSLRSYYYTSLVGDGPAIEEVRRRLWDLGFTPKVFKRGADQQKSKGVDISLCKDVLSHAFQDHYDAAVLIAGDGDYVPLVEEVKRLGKLVHVWFFEREGLNPALRLASDRFFDLSEGFLATWNSAIARGTSML
jgi:uncharacterized LabA/DUF88 family protein